MQFDQMPSDGMEQRKRFEKARQEILTKYLTKEARERLATLKYAHPDLAVSVENMIIQSAVANQIKSVIDDKKLKELLTAISESKNEGRVNIKRETNEP